ncbi:hypothetical protein DYB25_000302 [Aphanomyces astaci]|uniref:Uncharacterized protein n=1 Tax=Aphanomyces astaci TaxID=112090 RepID=A0A397FY01_APHAT|nr:hypothetical protein DYB36_005762 [Aphanomyces astaci]RHY07175.1 hypothetical protein DYB25_000302 [Aphanomyces astaci]RHY43525.1 hypothetical protein DYB34_000527 [Aphanomyces astaci]RHY63391.1 hypothetical protein DYB30_001158 [Aphanomyces astaci]RHY64056.1 hypothetical protein DYB38_000988 [Aphanomyces astaci]
MGNVVEPVHPSGGATMSCRGSSSSFTIAPKAKRHPADEISAICFCVDISDTIRFPLVALELQRLHEFQHSNKLATSWLLFTKSDCIQVKKGTAMDTYERLKTICTQLKKEPCNWGFTVMPLVNSNLEGSLLDVKNWIQETLPPKP